MLGKLSELDISELTKDNTPHVYDISEVVTHHRRCTTTLRAFEMIFAFSLVGFSFQLYAYLHPNEFNHAFITPPTLPYVATLAMICGGSSFAIICLRRLWVTPLALLLALSTGFVAYGINILSQQLVSWQMDYFYWPILLLASAAFTFFNFILLSIGVVSAIRLKRNNFWRHIRESSKSSDRKWFSAFLDLLGVPRITKARSVVQAISILLSLIATIVFAYGIDQVVTLWPEVTTYHNLSETLCSWQGERNSQAVVSCMYGQGLLSFLKIMLTTTAFLLLSLWIGSLLSAWAWRLLRTTAERHARRDPRTPIVFLRPFGSNANEDRVPLVPGGRGWLYFLANVVRLNTNLDQLLVSEGLSGGPVVAIGKPGHIPPSGATRVFCKDNAWQSVVESYLEKAGAVVLCLGESVGVQWELQAVSASRRERVIILANPDSRFVFKQRQMLREAMTSYGVHPALAAYIEDISFCFFRVHGRNVVLYAKGRDLETYRTAVRIFIRVAFEGLELPPIGAA